MPHKTLPTIIILRADNFTLVDQFWLLRVCNSISILAYSQLSYSNTHLGMFFNFIEIDWVIYLNCYTSITIKLIFNDLHGQWNIENKWNWKQTQFFVFCFMKKSLVFLCTCVSFSLKLNEAHQQIMAPRIFNRTQAELNWFDWISNMSNGKRNSCNGIAKFERYLFLFNPIEMLLQSTTARQPSNYIESRFFIVVSIKQLIR